MAIAGIVGAATSRALQLASSVFALVAECWCLALAREEPAGHRGRGSAITNLYYIESFNAI